MTYEELKISIDLNGYENVLPKIGKTRLDDSRWFIVCDDGDCHLFDVNGKENDIKKVTSIYGNMIPKDIKKIVIPNSVTRIKQSTFYGCDCLDSVTIGNNVTSIENWAFSYCIRLESIIIPNNVTNIWYFTFWNCNNLKSLIFKGKSLDQVKSMENYPFGIEDESIIKCI